MILSSIILSIMIMMIIHIIITTIIITIDTSSSLSSSLLLPLPLLLLTISLYISHLLFEVASLLLIDQNQVEVIPDGELLVDVPHGGRQFIPTQEQTYGDGFTCARTIYGDDTMTWNSQYQCPMMILLGLIFNSKFLVKKVGD